MRKPACLSDEAILYWHSGRTLVCDRYFTTISGSLRLNGLGLHNVGTLNANRITEDLAVHQCIGQQGRPASQFERGYFEDFVNDENGLSLTSWVDAKVVHMLSSRGVVGPNMFAYGGRK